MRYPGTRAGSAAVTMTQPLGPDVLWERNGSGPQLHLLGETQEYWHEDLPRQLLLQWDGQDVTTISRAAMAAWWAAPEKPDAQ
jgi:hypothetical protein